MHNARDQLNILHGALGALGVRNGNNINNPLRGVGVRMSERPPELPHLSTIPHSPQPHMSATVHRTDSRACTATPREYTNMFAKKRIYYRGIFNIFGQGRGMLAHTRTGPAQQRRSRGAATSKLPRWRLLCTAIPTNGENIRGPAEI